MNDLQTNMETSMSSFSLGSGSVDSPVNPELKNDEQGNIEQRIADLEMRPRMPAAGTGIDGNVLALDGVNPRWGDGSGLPDGVNDGDIIVWNDTTSVWEVFDSTSQIMRWWDGSTNEWKDIEVPAVDGKILQTATPEGVKFDFLKWR